MRDIHHPRFYRLLAKLPLTVSFKSVAYRLEIQAVIGAPVWELRAQTLAGDPNWTLCHRGQNRDEIEGAIFDEGFEVLSATVPDLILERMCAEGRAERLPQIDRRKVDANWEKRRRSRVTQPAG